MSTITAVLEADADGTLHVPLPEELRGVKVKITATIGRAEQTGEEQAARIIKAKAALLWLRAKGTFRNVDPVAWQKEVRADRPLLGRDDE